MTKIIKDSWKLYSQKIEGKLSIADKFRSATSNKNLNKRSSLPKNIPLSWIQIQFKAYPRLKKIKMETLRINPDVKKLFYNRISTRAFSQKNLVDFKEISSILNLSAGINRFNKNLDLTRRSYPSGGARYPIEIYIFIFKAKNIEKGIYHYNVRDNVLELLEEGDFSRWFREEAVNNDDILTKSPIVIVFTMVQSRTMIKYGNLGYKLGLIEAGHVAQNICLVSQAFNCGTCVMNGFDNVKMDKILDVDKLNEYSIYALAMGKIK